MRTFSIKWSPFIFFKELETLWDRLYKQAFWEKETYAAGIRPFPLSLSQAHAVNVPIYAGIQEYLIAKKIRPLKNTPAKKYKRSQRKNGAVSFTSAQISSKDDRLLLPPPRECLFSLFRSFRKLFFFRLTPLTITTEGVCSELDSIQPRCTGRTVYWNFLLFLNLKHRYKMVPRTLFRIFRWRNFWFAIKKIKQPPIFIENRNLNTPSALKACLKSA